METVSTSPGRGTIAAPSNRLSNAPMAAVPIRLLVSLLAVILAAPPVAARAGEARLERLLAMDLDELMALEVRISSLSPRPLGRAPGVVSVITAEDIRATGARNLADLLQSVPGLYVRASQFAFRPLPHVRGASASQTLLMIDGVPLKDLMWGFGIYWKGVPASAIERVEIIRGPGSALYGADAAAGVINVITRAAAGIDGSELGLRASHPSSHSVWLAHGDRIGTLDLALTAEVGRSAGHAPFIRADAQTAADRRDSTHLSHAPGTAVYGWRDEDVRLALSQGPWRLRIDHMRHTDVAIGLTGAGVLDPDTRAGDRRLGIHLSYIDESIRPDWGLGAELHYQHLAYGSGNGFFERPPGYADAGGVYPIGVINRMRAREGQWGLELSARYRGVAGHAIQIGAGQSRQGLHTFSQAGNDPADPARLVDLAPAPGLERERGIAYFYAQDTWTLDEDWELTAGARYDRYSDFGASFNPRFALVWQASREWTAKLMHGRAFRAPSYQELYLRSSLARPNPDLKPERSRTWDLSLEHVPNRAWRIGLNLFRLDQADLIARDGSGQFQNMGDHAIRGVELEAHWQPRPDLRLSLGHAWREQEDSPYRVWAVPERETHLRLDWAFRPGWHWNIQLNHSGRRDRPPGDTRPALAGHVLVDASLRYTPEPDWEFALSASNLFAARAREYTGPAIPDDLPLPGRQVHVELRYRF